MAKAYGRLLAGTFVLTVGASAQPRLTPLDGALASGVAQVKQGDHQKGLMTLDAALKKLRESNAPSADIAVAHLYMGVAYANLGHQQLAQDRFREALRLDNDLRLDPDDHSPAVMAAFEDARGRGWPRKKVAVIGGGVAAAAGTVAVIAAGGDGGSGGSSGPEPGPPGAPLGLDPVGPVPTCPQDGVSPQVAITFPPPLATVSATVVLRVTATDNVGVTELRFFVDDKLVGLAGAGTFELPWDSRTAQNGNHQISARAFDACRNQGFTQPVQVTVRN